MVLSRSALAFWVWLAGTAVCSAQETADTRSAWQTLADSAPVLWGCILIALILTSALLAQLIFFVRRHKMEPAALIEALGQSVRAGNYQEAWDACNRWHQTALARILQPALERIGQGWQVVEARITQEEARERQRISIQLRCLLGAAFVTVLFCLGTVATIMCAVRTAALTASSPRAGTLAFGNAAVPLALALAVAVVVLFAWLWFRAHSETLLKSAGTRAVELLAKLPYEEIEGVRIGQDFNAGNILDDGNLTPSGPLQVSTALTTQCPTCNGPINSSRNSCPHCGQLLAWS